MPTTNNIDRELSEADLDLVVGGDTALSHEAVHSSTSATNPTGPLLKITIHDVLVSSYGMGPAPN